MSNEMPFLEAQVAECVASCQQMRSEIDQVRAMIPLVRTGESEKNNGGGEAPEYICGNDSNVVFTEADNNQIKVDVYYV